MITVLLVERQASTPSCRSIKCRHLSLTILDCDKDVIHKLWYVREPRHHSWLFSYRSEIFSRHSLGGISLSPCLKMRSWYLGILIRTTFLNRHSLDLNLMTKFHVRRRAIKHFLERCSRRGSDRGSIWSSWNDHVSVIWCRNAHVAVDSGEILTSDELLKGKWKWKVGKQIAHFLWADWACLSVRRRQKISRS